MKRSGFNGFLCGACLIVFGCHGVREQEYMLIVEQDAQRKIIRGLVAAGVYGSEAECDSLRDGAEQESDQKDSDEEEDEETKSLMDIIAHKKKIDRYGLHAIDLLAEPDARGDRNNGTIERYAVSGCCVFGLLICQVWGHCHRGY